MIKKMYWKGIAVLVIAAVMVTAGLAARPQIGEVQAATKERYNEKAPKYVFLFIGDGMSYAQVSATEMYLGQKNAPDQMKPQQLNFTEFPIHGSLMTQDSSSFIPDSASTATSLASGHKTLSGVINMDVTKTETYSPITEDLKKKGYKIGIVTSVPITHATPAAFYAKVPSRNDAYDIGKQLAASGFDYFGGGDFDNKTGNDEKNPQRSVYEIAQEAGFTIADTKEKILALNGKSGKTIAIDPDPYETAMDYEIDRDADELGLPDYVRKGIDVLDNENGFFMMVEGGKIDWANHANDAASSIYDTIAFSDAVQEALDFYQRHPDETLIVVTADHECGGMTIGYSNTGSKTYFEKLQNVSVSYQSFDKIIDDYKAAQPENPKLTDLGDDIKTAYGLELETLTAYERELVENAFVKTLSDNIEPVDDQEKVLYGKYNPLSVTISHVMNNRAGLSFSSYSHTGLPVPIYAIGSGSELFEGFYDNTRVHDKLAAISELTDQD